MRYWLFLVILLLTRLNTHSQDDPFIFFNLKEEDGLSNNSVNCFLKDSRNILWVGTYNGFCRFDGANFYNYKIRKGSSSPANEVVHSLCEDRHGRLWAATDNGVFCYNPVTDLYINYTIKSLGKGPNFLNILCDKNGTIWAAGDRSVFKFDEQHNRFEELIKPGDNTGAGEKIRIKKNGLLQDPSGTGLWMATSAGLMFYNTSAHTLTNYKTTPGDSLFAMRNTGALSRSPSGNMWFFDNEQKAIISFDPVGRKILQKVHVGKYMPGAIGGTIFEDKNRRLWFSSWSYEMMVIDLAANNKIIKISNRPGDNRSIAGQFFWAGYQDEDNTIWLGTISGISKCNPEKNIYKAYRLYDLIPELRNTSIVFAEEDPADKSLWIITETGILINYDPASGNYTTHNAHEARPAPGGIRPIKINMVRFYKDYVILATYTGTWQLKKGDKQLRPLDILPKGYETFNCREIVFDGDSVIYYNNNRQILYWNRLTGTTDMFQFKDNTDNDEVVIENMFMGRDRRLWFISSHATIGYLENRQLHRQNIAGTVDVSNGVMVSIEQDTKGMIWLLNKGVGIYRFNPRTHEIKKWDETDGLTGNRVQKIMIDRSDRVWGMLNNNVSVYKPTTDSFYNFKIPYSESNFNYTNYISVKADGNLLGTINNDIMEFFPGKLFMVPVSGKPSISRFNVSGKEYNIFNTDKPVLQPRDNTVRFRFGSTIDQHIFPNDIEYRLDGAETRWTIAGESQEAVYNNLPSGSYTFRVRVKGKNSSWESPEATFSFRIKTPFYKTTWFLLLSALTLLGIVVLFYRYRLQQKEKLMLLENKAQMLEKEKAMVMYENLKQQLNPHFLFNSLTSLNSLIETEPKGASVFLDSLSKTYRYILKSRDNETVSLVDEIRFAENYVKLQKTRFEKGFDVRIAIPEEYHYRRIVPVTLQNLIENAIKHNIVDEESPLLVNIYVKDDSLVVENNLQKKNFVETSNRQGLANIQSLYQYLSNRPVEILETHNSFAIKLPLI